MSTRSTIGMLLPITNTKGNKFNENRPCFSIYCHNDGYLEHNGVLLDLFYRDKKVVMEMMKMGSMSSLGYTLGTQHDINKRYNDIEYYKKVKFMSSFYYRDKHPDGKTIDIFQGNLSDLPKESWNYLYVIEENKWYVLENGKWFDLHKRIFTQIAHIDDFFNTVKNTINPADKQALNQLKNYSNEFIKYRNEHPYLPSYDKLKTENDGREYWYKTGYGPKDIKYKVFHIDKIEKDTECKVIFFTPLDTNLNPSSVRFNYFIKQYFEDEGIVLKNPSKLVNHLPK